VLFEAVESGDVAATKRAVREKGVQVNAYTWHGGETPLMLAATEGNVELVNVLLAAGADPNLAPHVRYHHAALYYALTGTNEKTVEQINAVAKLLLAAR